MYTEQPSQERDRKKNFVYHPPLPGQPERYERIRAEAGKLSLLFNTNCPQSRELSLAQTKLEEATFWANAAIARNEPKLPEDKIDFNAR